ncbi:MAG: glycosyltransferase [Bacteroidetes bacterium]|nr:glycosyltransferase [Bacteroidota bacterium]
MNILFIHHHKKNKFSYRAGNFAKELVSKGHSVNAICISEKKHFRVTKYYENGVFYIETPDLFFGRARSGWDLWNTLIRIFLIKKLDFDLIFAFETRPATIYPVMYSLSKKKVPLIIDWVDWWGHGGLITENRPYWYRILFEKMETYYEENFRSLADGTVVISSGLINRAIDLGVNEKSIIELPNGSASEIKESTDSKIFRNMFNIPQNSFVICDTGKDVLIGNDLFFKAIQLVINSDPNVFFIMTGSKKEKFKTLASKYGIKDHFLHLGFLPTNELEMAMSCADVFIIPFEDKPSNKGRWPGKIGKYLSLGRPVITNPVGAMKSLLEKHQIGLLADQFPEDIASKITYLKNNPEECKVYGNNARRLAENELSWSNLTDRLEKFLYITANAFNR